METTDTTLVYHHSIKVPTQYRVAARLLKKTFEEGGSLKGLIFQEKHAKTNRLYALIQKISDHKPVLDRLVADTRLREREPRLEKFLCAVLMTELLFGAGRLNGECKPVQTVRRYESEFRRLLAGGKPVENDGAGNDGGGGVAAETGTGGGGAMPMPMLKKEYEKPRYVRVNTNLLSRAEALEIFARDGWQEREFAADTQTYDTFLEMVRTLGEREFVSDMHVRNLFVFPAASKRHWARNALVKESKLILQDKASCLPTVLLDPPRGATILDMCAAPGMKTSHLAAHIKNKGTIYAVEQHHRRYGTLCEIMLSTKSAVSVQPINQDALTLEDEGVPGVEYILVDPSCSGSGMTGRFFSTPEEKDIDRLMLLCGLQTRMLQHAMRAFHHAKKIVYSTCSVHVEENEQVVARCLEACGDEWELVKPATFAERWKHFGSAKWKHVGKKCFYAKPEVDLTDGFFVAVFERREGVLENRMERVHDPDRDFLEEVCRNFTRKSGQGLAEDEEQQQHQNEEFPTITSSSDVVVKPKSVKELEQSEVSEPIKKVKKMKKKDKKADETLSTTVKVEDTVVVTDEARKSKKKKKCKPIAEESATAVESDAPRKRKKTEETAADEAAVDVEAIAVEVSSVTPKKKKKKKDKSAE